MDTDKPRRRFDLYAVIASLCGVAGYILLVSLALAPDPFIAIPMP